MGIMRRRMRRRAVVGAAVVGSAVAANRHNPAADQGQQNEQEQQPVPAEPATDDKFDTLAKLAELHQSGALTDEEFAQQKAQILGS